MFVAFFVVLAPGRFKVDSPVCDRSGSPMGQALALLTIR